MGTAIVTALGGLGIFLLGMGIMTGGLRDLAGDALRRTLARFTRSPASGAATGAMVTALVQSSSATTVAAVGFVGAGLLTFAQAVGIIFGANIGTTITGWLVALLGFKLKLGTLVLPLILLGALLRLFARGRWLNGGTALAGFGLIFVGIGLLQDGLGGLEGTVTPASFPPDTPLGRVLLVLIGMLITLVTQSSSAGVATALVAVNAGTLGVTQAAAMVIGMDVATTVTAMVATVGGNDAARRTGFAHLFYNLLTGLLAFVMLTPWFWAVGHLAPRLLAEDPEIVLVAFHTSFNGLGVLLALPFAGTFARMVERIVPDRDAGLTAALDQRLLEVPGSAVDALAVSLRGLTGRVLGVLEAVLDDRPAPDLAATTQAVDACRRYATRIVVADPGLDARLVAALHVVDHLDRLIDRCGEPERAALAGRDRAIHQAVDDLRRSARRLGEWCGEDRQGGPPETDRAWHWLEAARGELRHHTMHRGVTEGASPETIDRELDAQRWARRSAYHLWRLAHHLDRLHGRPAEAEGSRREPVPGD